MNKNEAIDKPTIQFQKLWIEYYVYLSIRLHIVTEILIAQEYKCHFKSHVLSMLQDLPISNFDRPHEHPKTQDANC